MSGLLHMSVFSSMAGLVTAMQLPWLASKAGLVADSDTKGSCYVIQRQSRDNPPLYANTYAMLPHCGGVCISMVCWHEGPQKGIC